MKTAGDILREAREKQERTLSQISRQTRIKERFLSALEDCDWVNLPNFAVAQGFARNYAQIVGASPTHVIALLRRDFPQAKIKRRTDEVSLRPRSLWTPKTTVFVIVLVTLFALGGYLTREYLLFTASPVLNLEKMVADSKLVIVSGKTLPDATVQINGKSVLVNQNGEFKMEIERRELINSTIEIQAISRTGKKTVVEEQVPQ